ncbi:hypothetical protein [Natronococcus wangiae]|uniref:hypothetical protein n=1 Tax=Natronococcus wangiae TaxID=3068275 RepID=UPI00273F7EFE|nr:hypothetical protein [Natronococcus sp. AD5]
MEEFVGQYVPLQVADDGRIRPGRQHVVPLQELVKHDPAEKAARTDSEHDSRLNERFRTLVESEPGICLRRHTGYPQLSEKCTLLFSARGTR